MATTPIRWVFIDESEGAACANGDKLSPLALATILELALLQLNGEFSDEYGGRFTGRIGASASDIQPGERAFVFKATLPEAPGASAYHDVNGQGVPVAYCAVTTCADLFGPAGVLCDVSHELLEAAADEGADLQADDGRQTHAYEVCDPVEVQTYPKVASNGATGQVSNFVLRTWWIPGAAGPYDYMTAAGLAGAVAPPAPLVIAPGDGGNYQIVGPSSRAGQSQVFGKHDGPRIIGSPRKPAKVAHWTSRASRRLARFAAERDTLPPPPAT